MSSSKNQILDELRKLRSVLTKVIGSSDQAPNRQFSKEALEKAAVEFKKLSIERGEWVVERDFSKIFKKGCHGAGSFIRNHFKFENYFKRGHVYYYNKKDLIELARELNERNVDLARYIEYLSDVSKFRKYIESISIKNKGEYKLPFKIPSDAQGITTFPAKPPLATIIKEDINNLMKEFKQFKLSDYIDIYGDKYAMFKNIYFFDKYMPEDIKFRCSKWIKNYNYANDAFEKAKDNRRKRMALLIDHDN